MTAQLYYATDTYCVWCWGFYPSLRAFVDEHADQVKVDVVPGGLLTGDRAVPVGEKPRVLEAAARVGELCHVGFGDGFYAAVKEGTTVVDSLVAARLFVALRTLLGPGAGLDIAHALQHAWYHDGLDLSDAAVRVQIAQSLGADPATVDAHFRDPSSTTAAEAEFQRRKDIGARGYPTLLMETPDGLKQVGGPTSSPARLAECFAALQQGVELPAIADDDRE